MDSTTIAKMLVATANSINNDGETTGELVELAAALLLRAAGTERALGTGYADGPTGEFLIARANGLVDAATAARAAVEREFVPTYF